MSKTHSGYTDEVLQAMLGNAQTSSEAGKAAFLAEAGKPVSIEGAAPGSESTTEETPTPKTVPVKTDAMSRKLSGRMNKFKRTVAEEVPKIFDRALKAQSDELGFSQQDTELLAEGVETSLDVLDVDFQVAPISKTLTSPWWALIFPALALLMIMVPKLPLILEIIKAKQEEKGTLASPLPEATVND